MSPVRRRTPRKVHPALLAAILLLLLAVFALLYFRLKKDSVELAPLYVAQPVTLSDRETEEIAAIAVENRSGRYTLRNTEAGWRLDGSDEPLRDALLEPLVNDAALIVAEDTVGDLREHPEWQLFHYGLEDWAARVTVTFRDGASLAFRVGHAVPQETPAYYFCLEGDPHIYLVAADVYDAYITTALALHDVADPALNGGLIDRVAFTGRDPFALERRADGWYLTEPFTYPLSEGAVNGLLTKLEGLRFAQFEAEAADADLRLYGLEPPERTLILDIAETMVTGYDEKDAVVGEARLPAYQLTFGLGSEENDVVFHCLYKGQVLKATSFSAGFLRTQSYDSLFLTQPFNAPTNDLSRLIWEQGGVQTVYDVSLTERVLPNNALETDENGNVLYDLAVTKNGAPLDSDAFLNAYRQLVELRTLDRLPATYVLPAEKPLLRVTLARESGSARQIALYPLDALHRAVAVDGVALYQVEKGWAEDVEMP